MSFTQGSQTQTLSIQASNVFVFGGSVAAGNALTVQQLSTGSIASFQTVSGSTALFINSGGSVGIGLTNPSTALQVAGAITASAGFVGTLYGPIAGSNTIAASSMTLGTALAVAYGGTGTTTSTGSGSVVLSAGPTITGTLTCAAITSSGGTIQTSYAQGINAPSSGQAYFYNPTAAANQDASCGVRINGATARYAYYSMDVSGVAGYSFGIAGSSQNLVFRASWDMSTGTLFTMDRSGNFTATGSIAANSDMRIKKNLEVIPDALEKVKKLTGYTYERTDLPGKFTGVVAQEVLDVLPEAVLKDDAGMYSVVYGNIVGLLIEALKEESRKREVLEVQVKELVSKQ